MSSFIFLHSDSYADNLKQNDQEKLEIYLDKAFHALRNLSDSTIYYAEHLLNLSKGYNNIKGENFAYQILGSYYIKKGQITLGFDYQMRALALSESEKDWTNVSTINNNIGVYFFRKKDYEKALKYYQAALKAIHRDMEEAPEITNDLYDHEVSMMLNIGEVYLMWEQYELALKYEDAALINAMKYQFSDSEAYILAVKAQILYQLGKEKDALKHISEALIYFKKTANVDAQLEYELIYAKYQFESKYYDKARKSALSVLALSELKEAKHWNCEAYELLSIIEKQTGHWKSAFQYQSKYTLLKQELDNNEITARLTDIKESYNADKKNAEIYALKIQNELTEQVVSHQTKFIYVMVIVLFLGIISVYFLLKFNNNIKSAYHKISEKNSEIEAQSEEILSQRDHLQEYVEMLDSKNRRISSALNYAHRIQSATLPSRKSIELLVDKLILVYKPRDIVSGDFYYSSGILNRNNEKIGVVAGLDCTGHGIPGAFMSLIGNGILNELIKVENYTCPSEILEQLNIRIQDTLKQKDISTIQDGMDISICTINYTQKTATISSAKSSWLYFQNDRMHVMKGCRRSIGGIDLHTHPFVSHTIDLSSSPTQFYFYSDGYQDQIGGPKNKKFLVKRFRNLIASIQHLAPNKQEELLQKSLEDWRSIDDEPQTDDILVFGFTLKA
ncbi:tetratricopeptide repeat protein [Flammeovirga kamogawensis]|uniref:Tetratricopeptide repeat protein n=1 Tax=Flammeovirga kamogawensis TaxID=373891 RepID=A0ABX8H207_9BACT|nr:tetratricopeptide repeat protein [Flammeovirga kamogawensis]MBB6463782.1 serine phosphatase RsbU (regulator of sigma subunit) [Flammeovirga kamogawensis]QWG09709.1 tetratricopeptide repeat protein [Flammeovirga kamogawensis]TRX65221.1 tetratricopeptide repeat protein [Flammeovirga kamogawensis]